MTFPFGSFSLISSTQEVVSSSSLFYSLDTVRCSLRRHPTTSQTRLSQSLRTSSAFASVDDSHFQGRSSERKCRFVGWLVVVVLLTPDTAQKWIKFICFAVFHSRLIIINPLTFVHRSHSLLVIVTGKLSIFQQANRADNSAAPAMPLSLSRSSVDVVSPAHLLISQLIMETDVLFKMTRWDEVVCEKWRESGTAKSRKSIFLKLIFSLQQQQHQHVEPQPTRDLAPLLVYRGVWAEL